MDESENTILVIRASAGTGKTYRLTKEFRRSLNSDLGVRCPTEIISTTFTNMAADELIHRIRSALLEEGLWETAQALYSSSIGTVNSVCGRLVSDFAIEAGLSPSVKVISEALEQRSFDEATSDIQNAHASRLWPVITRMGMESEWRSHVKRIVDLARQNDIKSDQLHYFSETSWASYNKLLSAPGGTLRTFEDLLLEELRSSIRTLPAAGDTTKSTMQALHFLKELDSDFIALRQLTWPKLNKLAKINTGTISRPFVQKLATIAREHMLLPEFQADIQKMIRATFVCAADCLAAYREFKNERALVDFIDQEQIALSLLRNPTMSAAIENQFVSLLVDEFQDTSPIQLAVFLELSRKVHSSVWVGDEKQSIYGFRGADPELMHGILQKLIPKSNGVVDYLSKSFRSRPQLVEFVNSVFTHTMLGAGISAEDTFIGECSRSESPAMNHALHLWWLKGRNKIDSVRALANEICNTLNEPTQWMIETELGFRELRGNDIAILCRTNSTRLELATALSQFGILVSTERPGLLESPECILSIALLRFLADKYDTLALAEVFRYVDPGQNSQGWLFDWIEKGPKELVKSCSELEILEDLRGKLVGLSPTEALQVAITAPFVLNTIRGWGEVRQRSLNLEALLGIAHAYEEFCETSKNAATIGGLVTFINEAGSTAAQPANPDEQAVKVLTYHKAKGLEWPFVIMYDLDLPPDATPFGVHLNPSKDFDPHFPLANRVIRYWPWPYGQQVTGPGLGDAAKDCDETLDSQARGKTEALRLPYVGMTRARDYLVLACRESAGSSLLNMVTDKYGNECFQLSPPKSGQVNILCNAQNVFAVCKFVDSTPREISSSQRQQARFAFAENQSLNGAKALPYSCIPSAMRLSNPAESISIDKIYHLGGRLKLAEKTDIRTLGEALHLFLATDGEQLSTNEQLNLAREICVAFGLTMCDPEIFVEASTRLKRRIDELYPEACWLREWPLRGRLGQQRISGTVDLLLELTEGYVIIDHKSFPGDFDFWKERAKSHFPQINAYAQLVTQATKRLVIGTYIHMPVVGALLKLSAQGDIIAESFEGATTDDQWMVI